MKTLPGKAFQKCLHTTLQLNLVWQIDADQSHVKSIKNQFFQALFTYLVECFSNTEILTAAQVLEVKLFLQQECFSCDLGPCFCY